MLAVLEPGTTAAQAFERLIAIPRFANAKLANSNDEFIKLQLPIGLSVSEAVTLANTSNIPVKAQPNYLYQPQGDSQTAATWELEQTAIASSADLIAGTALGNALSAQSETPNDPYLSRQWSLNNMRIPEAWDTLLNATANRDASGKTPATPVTVAIIDAGFNIDHIDLADNVIDYYDAGGNANNTTSNINHGTHAAGIVGAVTNNNLGIAGIAYNACKIYALCARNGKGEITTETVADAYKEMLSKASKYNIRVVNMSLGRGSKTAIDHRTDAVLYNAIAKARKAGIVSVASSCNVNDDFAAPFYSLPSDYDNVISVIDLGQAANADGVARYRTSNYNKGKQKAKDISAPGQDILGLYGSGQLYGELSGTSMASPAVAGVLGLMFTVDPTLTADEAESKLYSTAFDLTQSQGTSPGWDAATGYGEVDAAAALDVDAPYLSGSPLVNGSSSLIVKVNGKSQDPLQWTWSSSNPKIAKPDASGVVHGYKTGQAVITATKDGKATMQTVTVTTASASTPVYSLFNKKTKQWVYTTSAKKRDKLVKAGWKKKGVAWRAPTTSQDPVYCLYNKSTKRYKYLIDTSKVNNLVSTGWKNKGIAFYSDMGKSKKVYRLYNKTTKAYRYTTNKKTPTGWLKKGAPFYAV